MAGFVLVWSPVPVRPVHVASPAVLWPTETMLEPAPMAQLPPVFPAMIVLFRRGTAVVEPAKKPTLLERPPPLAAGAVLVLSVTLKSFNAPPFSIPPPKWAVEFCAKVTFSSVAVPSPAFVSPPPPQPAGATPPLNDTFDRITVAWLCTRPPWEWLLKPGAPVPSRRLRLPMKANAPVSRSKTRSMSFASMIVAPAPSPVIVIGVLRSRSPTAGSLIVPPMVAASVVPAAAARVRLYVPAGT